MPAGRNRNTNRRNLIIALAILALMALVVFLRGCGRDEAQETTYDFGKVERGQVRNSVSATGTIQPWKVVDVKSNVAGRIDRLSVDLGDTVSSGDLIALIDPTDTRSAFEQAQAEMTSAEASAAQARASSAIQPALTQQSIEQAQAGLAAASKAVTQARRQRDQVQRELENQREVTNPQNLENAQADLEQAQANVAAGKAEHERQRQLLAKGYASRSEVETAEARLATLQAALRTAQQRASTIKRQNQLAVEQLQARLAAAESSIEESSARVKQQQAALEVARSNKYQDYVKRKQYEAARTQITKSQAALRQAATNLEYTRIVAPRSGVIVAKNVEEGTVVPSSRGSIGSTNALLQIADMSVVWVVCNVDETDIAQVSRGQRTIVRVDAYPDIQIEGRVTRIDPQAKLEQNVTVIPVTVEIRDPDPRLKPAMNAECEFVVDEVANALVIPNEALIERQGKYVVQKMVDGKPKDFPVAIGVMGEDLVEIKSGLKQGEEIITRTYEPEPEEANNPLGFRGPGQRRGSSSQGGRPSGGMTGGGRPQAGGGSSGAGGRPGGGGR